MVKPLSIRPTGRIVPLVTAKLVDCLRDQVESMALEGVEFQVCLGGRRLRRLLLDSVDVLSDSDWTLESVYPQLCYLHIDTSYPRNYEFEHLPPVHIPRLKSFYATNSGIYPSPNLLDQLTSLHIDEMEAFEEQFPTPKLNHLHLLSISIYSADDDIFFPLAKMPRFLHLDRYPPQYAVDSLSYQLNDRRGGLELVFWDERDFPISQDEVEDQLDEGGLAGLEEVILSLAKRGVKVVRGRIQFRDAVDRMDAVLAKDKEQRMVEGWA